MKILGNVSRGLVASSGEEDGIWRSVFDAFPAWIFLVDEDVRILSYNAAAAALLGPEPEQAIGLRGGEILHCIHSTEMDAGCGHAPSCGDCMVRGTVRDCYARAQVIRQRGRMQLHTGSETREIFLLICAVPVRIHDRVLVALVLEDISQLTELERIIPICAGCRKVKRNSSDWEPIEAHFRKRLEMEFSHGLCPDCLAHYSGMLRPPAEKPSPLAEG
jgi:PAS domain S-box-containing protein